MGLRIGEKRNKTGLEQIKSFQGLPWGTSWGILEKRKSPCPPSLTALLSFLPGLSFLTFLSPCLVLYSPPFCLTSSSLPLQYIPFPNSYLTSSPFLSLTLPSCRRKFSLSTLSPHFFLVSFHYIPCIYYLYKLHIESTL